VAPLTDSKAAARVLASGYVFDAKAFEMISELPSELDLESLVDRLLQQKATVQLDGKVVTEDDVAKALPPDFIPAGSQRQQPVDEPVNLEVMSDPTLAISPAEANEGYNRLFRDRYERLMSIVRSRPDARGVVGVSTLKETTERSKIKVAGLITGRINRKNNVEITLDDPSGTARVSCQVESVIRSAMEAPLDGMVVAEVSKGRSGQFYANSIMLPDVPGRKVISISHRVYSVLLSDLHIGSRMFLEEDFKRFIRWLNGEFGDSDIVNRVRYVVVAGDVVDGVGVYPGQEYQLVERDPKKQYEMAAELLKQIPPRMQIVLSPGNHDAVRQALPQPAVGLDIAESLYSMHNVRWVGDPSYIKLHGVNILVYHGKSLDDVIATTPDLSYDRPTDAMKLLLRSRHLAPTYGKRTALSPELRDFMVIDPVPDILHSGHVHTFGELNYRGTLLINSGTWQSQTSFQSNMGLEPTPSIVPIVDLSTLQVIRRNFGQAGFAGS
jgi:DNA polymerase II small subunit